MSRASEILRWGGEAVDEDLTTLRSSATDALEFELWAFGDNDDTDCGHSGLGFWVEVEVDAG